MEVSKNVGKSHKIGLITLALVGLSWPVLAADIGMASFYGREHAGHRTASGRQFDPAAMTAAHRTFPFGSRLRVTNLRNGKTVVVEIADRGPFRRGRIIDVSYGAARALDFVRDGVTRVQVDPL
jgi:rare lipoprotein A